MKSKRIGGIKGRIKQSIGRRMKERKTEKIRKRKKDKKIEKNRA